MKPAAPVRDDASALPAPEDLKVVEAFVNTLDRTAGTDSLSTLWSLNLWMRGHELLEKGTLEATDLLWAYEVREALRILLESKYGAEVTPATIDVLNRAAAQGQLHLRFHADGGIRLQSRDRDFPGALGQLLSYVVTAQQAGLWSRLKICGACDRVFFDSSERGRIDWCSPRCAGKVRCRTFPRRP